MVYKWRFHQYSVPASTVGKIIEDIEQKHGEVTAELLLERAKPKESEIHSLFEWDNKKAAEKYRLEQATRLIVALAVVYDEDDHPEDHIIRAFANVGSRKHGQFITMATALSNEDSRAVVLQHAMEELQAFKSKYAALSELAEIFKAIRALEETG